MGPAVGSPENRTVGCWGRSLLGLAAERGRSDDGNEDSNDDINDERVI